MKRTKAKRARVIGSIMLAVSFLMIFGGVGHVDFATETGDAMSILELVISYGASLMGIVILYFSYGLIAASDAILGRKR